MNIGEQIKALRQERGMTQERLAGLLGVSAQAVSKWENRLTAPDISLLPALAGVLGTSIDRLFGYNQRETEREAADICQKARAVMESDRAKGREILAEGLKRFPGSDALQNCYLYALDWETDNEEIIRVASALAECAREESVRLDAVRFLAESYARKGEPDFARAAVERLPEMSFTRHSVAAQVLRGEEKKKAADAQKWASLELLVDMMRELALCYEAEGHPEKARAEREKARELIGLFADGEHPWVGELLIETEEASVPDLEM